jgi:hypothetical protein
MTTDICAICHDLLETELKTLVCKHVFHAECIDAWTARVNQCPYCRTVLGPSRFPAESDTELSGEWGDIEQRVFDEFNHTSYDSNEYDSQLTMDDDEARERGALFHGRMFEFAARSPGLAVTMDWIRASEELQLSQSAIKIFIDLYNLGEFRAEYAKSVFDNLAQYQDLDTDIIRTHADLFDMNLIALYQPLDVLSGLGIDDVPVPLEPISVVN